MATDGNISATKICFKFYCNLCDYGTCKKSSYINHCNSIKHKKHNLGHNGNVLATEICCSTYICEKCDRKYRDRTGLWKHKKKCNTETNTNNNVTEVIHEVINKDNLINMLVTQNKELIELLKKCDRKYRDRTGLWKHKKKCNTETNTNNNVTEVIHEVINKDNLINMLVTQNKELIELLKHGMINNNINNNNINNNTTNIENKTFNLNLFLNETCKNAMNISDFVSSIQVNLEDLEYTGRQGYIQGISNIILNNLQKLEQHERPLHCNDLKREILYIKENNKWEKEKDNKPILTKAIKTIANENIKQIKFWREKYPDCTDSDSKKNNLYLKIVSNSMNGLTEEEGHRNIDKIISNVAKEVIIDKL